MFTAGATVDFVTGSGTAFMNFENLTGSSQNDNITGATEFSTIDLGAGNDTMTWNGETTFASVSGGVGTDTLILTAGGTVDFVSGYATTFTGLKI